MRAFDVFDAHLAFRAWAFPGATGFTTANPDSVRRMHAGTNGSETRLMPGGDEIIQKDYHTSAPYADVWKFYSTKTGTESFHPVECTSFGSGGGYGDNTGRSLMSAEVSPESRQATFTQAIGRQVFYITIINRFGDSQTHIKLERVKT